MISNKGLSIIALFMIAGIVGCSMISKQSLNSARSYAIDSATVATEIAQFKGFYTMVEKSVRDKQEREKLFTDDEWKQMLDLDESIEALLLKSSYIVKFDYKNVQLYDVEFMWTMAQESYQRCEKIIASKFDSFTATEKLQLQVLDKQVKTMNKDIENLFKNPTNENITRTILLITNVLSITVKVVGLIAAV